MSGSAGLDWCHTGCSFSHGTTIPVSEQGHQALDHTVYHWWRYVQNLANVLNALKLMSFNGKQYAIYYRVHYLFYLSMSIFIYLFTAAVGYPDCVPCCPNQY